MKIVKLIFGVLFLILVGRVGLYMYASAQGVSVEKNNDDQLKLSALYNISGFAPEIQEYNPDSPYVTMFSKHLSLTY